MLSRARFLSVFRWRSQANRVYPNGTQKKSPNSVAFHFLAHAICGRDAIGTDKREEALYI